MATYRVNGNSRPTPNFRIQEMANTQTKEDIQLELSKEVLDHLSMMQELRDWAVKTYPDKFGKSGLLVSSWYRAPQFNRSVGGASNSAHLDGRATDINNIPKELHGDFTIAWQVICSIHGKVGGVELYNWGMHFDSYSDKFGHKTFRTKKNY